VHLSICPPAPARPLLDGISVKFDIVDFHENLSRIFECVSSRTKLSGTVHDDLNVCIIVNDTCSASVYKSHWYACMATRYMLIALLTTIYVREKYKWKAFCFSAATVDTRTCHNVVIRRLPTLLYFKLSPCSECCVLSSGWFTCVCSLNANFSEHCVCSIFIGG
jgi:hypothetical protein